MLPSLGWIKVTGVEFITGYCRNALWEQWGLFCGDVFVRESISSFTRTWAVPLQQGLFFYKPIRLEWLRSRIGCGPINEPISAGR